jgi:hypothetical protein
LCVSAGAAALEVLNGEAGDVASVEVSEPLHALSTPTARTPAMSDTARTRVALRLLTQPDSAAEMFVGSSFDEDSIKTRRSHRAANLWATKCGKGV